MVSFQIIFTDNNIFRFMLHSHFSLRPVDNITLKRQPAQRKKRKRYKKIKIIRYKQKDKIPKIQKRDTMTTTVFQRDQLSTS